MERQEFSLQKRRKVAELSGEKQREGGEKLLSREKLEQKENKFKE